jgi:hypothetical protein
MNASLWRLSQRHGPFLCPDSQIPLHAVADSPADDTPGIQVKNNGQIQPALACPNVGYISRPFLVRGIPCPAVHVYMRERGREILIQQIGGDVKGMIAVGRNLEFSGSDNLYVIVPHQAPHTPVAYTQPQFLQLFSHPRAVVALQAKTMLITNMGQYHHIITLTLTHWTNPPCSKAT